MGRPLYGGRGLKFSTFTVLRGSLTVALYTEGVD